MVQSFDTRALQMVHKKWPKMTILYLIGKRKESLEETIKKLGFKPDIISQNHKNINEDRVKLLHKNGIKCMAGVINSIDIMKKIKGLGVDGAMSDYPDLFKRLK